MCNGSDYFRSCTIFRSVFGTTLLFALDAFGPMPILFLPIVFLTGPWILNGLGIAWIVQQVRRIRAESNTDAADAA